MTSPEGPDQIALGGVLRRLAHHSFVYGLASTLGRAISFFLLPVYTTALATSEYGIFATINAFLALAVPLAGLGLAGAAARFHVDIPDAREREGFYGGTWWVSLAAGAVVAVSGLLFFPSLLQRGMPGVSFEPYIQWSLLTMALLTVQPVALARLQMDERPVAFLVYEVGYYIAHNVAIVVFVVVREDGALGVVRGQLVAAALATVASAAVMGRGLLHPSFTRLRRSLTYGLPLVPHVIGGWFIAAADRFLLQRYLAVAAVGVYAVAYQFGSILELFYAAANRAWMPIFLRINAEQSEAAAKDAVARLVSLLGAGIAFSALAFGVVAPPALRLFANPAYHEGARYVPLLVAAAAFGALYYLASGPLFWRGRTSLLSVATLSAAMVNVAGNVVFIPRYGAMGAAIATVGSYVVLFLVTAVASLAVFPVRYERRLGLLAVVTGAYLGALWGAATWGAGMVVKMILVLSFPATLAATGYFRRSEIERASRLAGKPFSGGRPPPSPPVA